MPHVFDPPPPAREHPVDMQVFDEITIKTVPRWKTSHASGDEWRYKALVTLKYKGRTLDETLWMNTEVAVSRLVTITNNYKETVMDWNKEREERAPYCDQEGCDQEATVTLQLKKRCCTSCGTDRQPVCFSPGYRRYCDMHSKRGDCSIEDADDNYEVVPTPPPPPQKRERPNPEDAFTKFYEETFSSAVFY